MVDRVSRLHRPRLSDRREPRSSSSPADTVGSSRVADGWKPGGVERLVVHRLVGSEAGCVHRLRKQRKPGGASNVHRPPNDHRPGMLQPGRHKPSQRDDTSIVPAGEAGVVRSVACVT